MKQEDKNLLIQDLCARLPYGVKCYKMTFKPELAEEVICMLRNGSHNCVQLGTFLYRLEHIKPYLFPMSSMTEEQYKEFTDMGYSVTENWWSMANYHQIDWLNKNHFDYRGLIEKGLAIDCTNLNIY
jgi:hypothetical protein